MHVGKKSQKREKSVMSVSLYGNVVFVVIVLVMAIATGSSGSPPGRSLRWSGVFYAASVRVPDSTFIPPVK